MAVTTGPNRSGKPSRPGTRPQHQPPPTGSQAVADVKSLTQREQRTLSRTTAALTGALMQSGHSPQTSLQLARVLLSQKGIAIDPTGQIKYNGRVYSPQAFADSGLSRLYSGQRAAAENRAAIVSQPDYLQAHATLGLTRDQTLAALKQAETQAEINYGDPAFASGTTAAQAAANPFSLTHLIGQAYTRQQQATRQASNDAGTLFGGGYASGQAEDARVHAQQVSNAVAAIQQQLGGYQQQEAAANQNYNLGLQNALITAQQNLLKSGAFNAATRPAWTMGPGAGYYGFQHGHVGGLSGGGVAPPPPPYPNTAGPYQPPKPPAYPGA